MKSLSFFVVIAFYLTIEATISAPLGDDSDIFSNSETRNYGYPFYWLLRPVYEDENDYAGNEEPSLDLNKKNPAISLVQVGAGWGR